MKNYRDFWLGGRASARGIRGKSRDKKLKMPHAGEKKIELVWILPRKHNKRQEKRAKV